MKNEPLSIGFYKNQLRDTSPCKNEPISMSRANVLGDRSISVFKLKLKGMTCMSIFKHEGYKVFINIMFVHIN